MLPSNLLVTRKWRDTIRPVYARLDDRNLEAARLLLQMYENHVGKRKDELNEATEVLEDLGYDYRYIRGLSALLDRRCQLELEAAVDPLKARRSVFKIAHQKSLPLAQEAREAILRQAASELKVAVEDLEESLYADLEDEFILKRFETADATALVRQYNLSLTQTLLFFSTELTFTTVGNWQNIFRQIKWLGLIYTIRTEKHMIQVKVDGPASLFKLNRRYGTSLAKLLPAIIQNKEWSLKAKILRRKGDRRLLNLELDSHKHGVYMKVQNRQGKTKAYDSKVERDFADRFRALDTGWKLTREPDPVTVGRNVMIPDFGLQKGVMKIYLEVVGFWTPQYLEEKVKKLSLLGDTDMIIAADRDLACEKLGKIGKRLKVIYYHRKIPLRPILSHLKAREEWLVKEQARLLRLENLVLKKNVVEIRELAKNLMVLEDALKKALATKKFPGYVRLGDMFIRTESLDEIGKRMENRLEKEDLSLNEASEIIEAAGGTDPIRILEALGYKVEWQGIDPQSAKIYKVP
jgi:predicted nuclease of restriction endonuclease-like RecB superfamily